MRRRVWACFTSRDAIRYSAHRLLPALCALALILAFLPLVQGATSDGLPGTSTHGRQRELSSQWTGGQAPLSTGRFYPVAAGPEAFAPRTGVQALGWTGVSAVYSGPALAPERNDVARHSILNVDPAWHELGLYGQGQIVAVADTGLDVGDLQALSADFGGRVRQTFALGRTGDWSDPNGHGTHVTGSVLGSGVLSGSDPATHQYDGSFSGVAPEAELVFQSLLDSEGGLGGLPNDLRDLLQQAYDAGARIHTNSWGANFFLKPLTRFLSAGRYTAESAQVDDFIWSHPDMVVLFAAGNDGVDYFSGSGGGLEFPPPDGVVDPGSLASPSTAKNVITVGASEGLRSIGGHAEEPWGNEEDLLSAVMGYSYTAEPIASDVPSDNADGMAPFSSRGPSNDGRIKPDVVAPGTNILSARSHAPGAEDLFGPYNENYVFCSGTSMATPLVAGVVTLIRQWYVDRQGVSSPSAALIKATLINGAMDISPGQFGAGPKQDVPDAWPNPVTGWGRVNLAASIDPGGGREVWFQDVAAGMETGQEATFARYAGASGEPLRVTLVWTDPPGPIEPEGLYLPGLTDSPPPGLVNDLDLVVEGPDGRRFLGNMGDAADRLNNVEAVRVPNPVAGEYRIVVRAHQVSLGPQPFALVVAGQQVVTGAVQEEVQPTTAPGPVEVTASPTEAAAPVAGVGEGSGQEIVTPSATGEPEEEGGGIAEEGSGPQGGEEEESRSPWLIPLVVALAVLVVALGGAVAYALRLQRQPGGAGRAAAGRRVAAAGGRVAADLVALQGPLAGQRLTLSRSPFILGRGAECDLVIPDSHGSRQHTSLEEHAGRWTVHDLGSANGTFLNRQRLESPQPLHSGDLIYAGQSVLVFERQAGAPAARAVAGRARAQRRRSVLAVALGITLVLLTLASAAVILLTMEPVESGVGDLLPGAGLPTVSLPTGLPSVDLPIDVPTLGIPTGMPPLPTGGIQVPTISLPGLGGGSQ